MRVSTAGSTSCSARFIASCPSCPSSCTSRASAAPPGCGASLRLATAAAPAQRTIYVHAKAPPASALHDTSTSTRADPTAVATMTNHVARLYALATSLIVFFAVWLAVSAHPWSQTAEAAPGGDPQMARLVARERRLRAETREST